MRDNEQKVSAIEVGLGKKPGRVQKAETPVSTPLTHD